MHEGGKLFHKRLLGFTKVGSPARISIRHPVNLSEFEHLWRWAGRALVISASGREGLTGQIRSLRTRSLLG